MEDIQNTEGIQELNNAQKAKLEELAQNEEFVNAIRNSEKAEQIVELFQEQGFEVTAEEAGMLKDLMVKFENGELTDEDLEKINGGMVGFVIGAIITCFVGGLGLGVLLGL